ncbi:MAG: helix-turn-helix domain-containing protein, partial [Prevotella sp.]
SRHWLIMAGTILAAVCLAGGLLLMRNRRRNPPVAEKDLDQQTEEGEQPTATADEDSELMQKIRLLMEAKRLYLNPNLKVTDVADTLGIHRNSISACINTQEGCTFAQYVNRYRMEHVKQTLLEQPDRKINAVATESGFANETSFFRNFKSATGMTPREWVTAYAQKRQND